jgi:hypothetical protein
MESSQSTPSVDFRFEDASGTHAYSPPPLEESQLVYDLSCTNDKKYVEIEETTIAPNFDSNRQPTLKNISYFDNIDT